MARFEGVASGAQIERKRRIDSWHQILSSDELVDAQKQVLDVLSKEIDSPERLRDELVAYEATHQLVVEELSEVPTFSHPGLLTERNSFLHTINDTESGKNSKLRFLSVSSTLSDSELRLINSFGLLHKKVTELVSDMEIRLSPEMQEIYKNSTQLATPQKITVDNVQTYLDVFRFTIRGIENIERENRVIESLLRERSEYTYETPEGRSVDLNPQRNTNIELLARAPFSFWATSRFDVPIRIDGEDVRDMSGEDSLFSVKFIRMISREKIDVIHPEEDEPDTLVRHGGCPVLHAGKDKDELIKETGEVYFDFYRSLYGD